MGDLSSVALPDGMSSSSDDLFNAFYLPCLAQASSYKRAAGYFSGGLVAIAALAFADFTLRGGHMQLVCSPQMRQEDLDALDGDNIPSSLPRSAAYEELVALRDSSDLSKALTQVLSSMLASGVLDVRLLLPERRSSRLFHDKLGIFSDGKSQVSFLGSANETVAAWAEMGNHENIEIFRSWQSEADRRRIDRHIDDFEIVWQGPPGWRVVRRSELHDLAFSVTPPEDIEVSFGRVREMVEQAKTRSKPAPTPKRPERIREPRILRPHQTGALESWKAQGQRGIIAFATGGGKTLTAIQAIREAHFERRPSLVLVPSQLLHAQWMSEMSDELPGANIVPFGAGYSALGRESVLRTASSTGASVLLSTYATASTEAFLRAFKPHPQMLIVADEVHTAGQPEFRKFLELPFEGPRLGLSATPERYGDDVGTDMIFKYFGSIVEPRFGITEAIEAGQLVPYEYGFETIPLTEAEYEDWEDLSQRISQAIARSDDSDEARMRINLLLQKRARIAKSAALKPSMALRVIRDNIRPHDRWLVYCSDQSQMRDAREQLNHLAAPLLEYHHNMAGGRVETLEAFGRDGGIMLAIQCLDEGVDIPEINKAVILASSTNPRQYIQRRGRVLRRCDYLNKHSASIWDCLVTDPNGRLLTAGEAIRAQEFVQTSMSVATGVRLAGLLAKSGMSADIDISNTEESSNESD